MLNEWQSNHQSETPVVQDKKMEYSQTGSDETQRKKKSGAKSDVLDTQVVDASQTSSDTAVSQVREPVSGPGQGVKGTVEAEKSPLQKDEGERNESPKSVPGDGEEIKRINMLPQPTSQPIIEKSKKAKGKVRKEGEKLSSTKGLSDVKETSQTTSDTTSPKKRVKKRSGKQTNKQAEGVENLNADIKHTYTDKSDAKGSVIPGTSTEAAKIDLLQSSTAEKFTKNDVRRTALVNEFVKQIHTFCMEQGFEPTGRQYMRARANLFELVGLRSLYMEHLKKTAAKACNFSKERIRRKLFLASNHRPAVDFLVGIVSGVPGSGKSTLVRKLLDSPISCFVALANPALERDYRGASNVMPLDDLLLARVPMSSDLLVIDEYTLAESAEILLLQRRLRSSLVLLVGDVAQGKSNSASNIEYLTLPVIYRKTESHRIGEETAKLCSKQGNRIQSKGRKDKIVLSDYEGETETTDKNLAFTKETRDDVIDCGYDCSLVSEVQGLEYDSVTLFLRDTDKSAASNHSWRLVALTRHKNLLIIRAEEGIGQPFLTGDLSVSSKQPSNAHIYSTE